MKTPPRLRHIHIESGPITLDFRGTAEQVGNVAEELATTADLTVTVDDNVHPGQPFLPCAELWDPSLTKPTDNATHTQPPRTP